MNGRHIPDAVCLDVRLTFNRLKQITNLSYKKLAGFAGISLSKFSEWNNKQLGVAKSRSIPNFHRITDTEKENVIEFKRQNMNIGYRNLCWMMVDRNIAFISPSSVLRILKNAGLNTIWTHCPGEKKKKGFDQPASVHEQWHTDISYVNFKGTFVYLIAVLDGFSRAVLAWDIRSSMTQFDVSIVLYRAWENWILGTDLHPRVISDNGKQFLSKEYKMALRDSGLTHTKTAPYHPQSNGKLERFHGTAKNECLRITPVYSVEHMKAEFGKWIEYYNCKRLHSAIEYVTPMDVIEGRKEKILEERKVKLKNAKEARRKINQIQNPLALTA